METSDDIHIPEVVPVMTLQETVLFPHAVMPLFIFEPRYRNMLRDVLQSHRLFAIFQESEVDEQHGHEEPPAVMGTVGVVRAAHQNPDGTSNLALQGICRVRLIEVVQESPYRMIRIAPCKDAPDETHQLLPARDKIISLIDEHPHLTQGLPQEYVKFIHSVEGYGPFIDVAAHSICQDSQFKQELLETLCLSRRFDLFRKFLDGECRKHQLFKLMQGLTKDEEIDLN
jgi:ATP-dependent Lon protease